MSIGYKIYDDLDALCNGSKNLEKNVKYFSHPPFLWYFMTKCSKQEKWFAPLKQRGFFSFNHYLQWKQDAGNRFWPQLKFLTGLAEKVADKKDMLEQILLIVKEFSENADKVNDELLWSSFIDILIAIPKKYLHTFAEKHNVRWTDWFEEWFQDSGEAEILTGDISAKFLPHLLDGCSERDFELARDILVLLLRLEEKKESFGSFETTKMGLKYSTYWIAQGLMKKEVLDVLARMDKENFLVMFLVEKIISMIESDNLLYLIEVIPINLMQGYAADRDEYLLASLLLELLLRKAEYQDEIKLLQKIAEDPKQGKSNILAKIIKFVLKKYEDKYDSYRRYLDKKADEFSNLDINSVSSPKVLWTNKEIPLYKKDWFLSQKVEDIISVLADIEKYSHPSFPESPTLEETLKEFSTAVEENPIHFIKEIRQFKDCNYTVVYNLLEGIKKAITSGKYVPLKEVFDFIYVYLTEGYFGYGKDKDDNLPLFWSSDKNSILFIVGSLILEIADEYSFPEKEVKVIDRIFSELLAKRFSDYPKVNDLQEAINTPEGRIIESWIFFNFKKAEFLMESGKRKRKTKIVNFAFYDSLLGKRNKDGKCVFPEAYTFLGEYLVNFMYWDSRDKKWVRSKIEQLLRLSTNNILWQGFMYGYLGAPQINRKLYLWMQEHYRRAIEAEFEKKSIKKKIVEHALLAYLTPMKGTSKEVRQGLLNYIVEGYFDKFYKYLGRALSHFVKQATDSPRNWQDRKAGLKYLWGHFLERAEKALKDNDDGYKLFLSYLIESVLVFERLSEVYPSLVKISKYIDNGWDVAGFLKWISTFRKKGELKMAGEIVLEMVRYYIPPYGYQPIVEIVEDLYNSGKPEYTEIANAICDKCAYSGAMFLRAVWEKYRGGGI